mgnify:CR=1 FL=1
MIEVNDEHRLLAQSMKEKKADMEMYREVELPASAMIFVDLTMENVREAGYTPDELKDEEFPADKLHGREADIFAARDAKLQKARERRAANRRRAKAVEPCYTENAWPEDRATVGTDPSAVSGLEAEVGVGLGSTPASPFCFEANAINPWGSGGLVPQSKKHSLQSFFNQPISARQNSSLH